MRKKEREDLKNEIAYRNMMTKKLGRSMKMFFFIFLLFAAIAIWGFSGLHDNFLTVSASVRDVLKWIGLILGIVFGVLTLMYFLSFQNSKKYTLSLIDKLQKK